MFQFTINGIHLKVYILRWKSATKYAKKFDSHNVKFYPKFHLILFTGVSFLGGG